MSEERQPLLVTPQQERNIRQVLAWVMGMGPPFIKNPSGIGINLPPSPPPSRPSGSGGGDWLRGKVYNSESNSLTPDNSFKYDLFDLAGTKLNTDKLTPEWVWPEVDMDAAPEGSWCWYYIGTDGAPHLVLVNQVETADDCTPP